MGTSTNWCYIKCRAYKVQKFESNLISKSGVQWKFASRIATSQLKDTQQSDPDLGILSVLRFIVPLFMWTSAGISGFLLWNCCEEIWWTGNYWIWINSRDSEMINNITKLINKCANLLINVIIMYTICTIYVYCYVYSDSREYELVVISLFSHIYHNNHYIVSFSHVHRTR